MASNLEQHMVKLAKEKTGFGSFKTELADILTEDIISQLAFYFNYPPVKYDLLKKDVGRNYLMVHYMEERGQITETDITTLLRALEARQLHGIQKRVQTMFELHTGRQCTGDEQSPQQPEVSWTPTEHGFHLDSSRGKWVSNSKEATTLETKGQNILRLLCSSTVYLRRTDSKQLQMSTILLIEVASSHNIPISKLCLEWSFSGFDGENIRLESGLSLSSLSSVEKISINRKGKGNTLSEEEVIGLINYGIKSPSFKKLRLLNCKLPSSIKPDILPEESRSRNIKVISSNESRYLDLKSGQWRKPDDIQTITEMCSSVLIIDRDTSESVQRSVIELLVEASNHDIPIFEVTLGWSFSKIDEDGNIILSSGLSLPIITSIEIMEIQTEKGREMNEHEVNGILNYLQHSQRFKELHLSDCLLPSSIPVGPSLSTLKSRGVEVLWIPVYAKFDERYKLDLDSGRWEKAGSW